MALKLIVNGYFRSGTTRLWFGLKTQLNIPIYYEPLHPQLGSFIESAEKDGTHGLELWREYGDLNPAIKLRLLLNHPFNMPHPNTSVSSLRSYFNIYDEDIQGDCAVQLNRAHLLLDELARCYSVKIIHILRHPDFVYDSISQVVYKKQGFIGKLIYLLYKRFKKIDPFEINRDFALLKRLGLLPVECFKFSQRLNLIFSRKSRFLVVWTLMNSVAIGCVRREGGMVLWYEDLCDPKLKNYLNDRLNEYIGYSIPLDVFEEKYERSSDWLKIEGLCRRFGLSEQLTIIRNSELDVSKI